MPTVLFVIFKVYSLYTNIGLGLVYLFYIRFGHFGEFLHASSDLKSEVENRTHS